MYSKYFSDDYSNKTAFVKFWSIFPPPTATKYDIIRHMTKETKKKTTTQTSSAAEEKKAAAPTKKAVAHHHDHAHEPTAADLLKDMLVDDPTLEFTIAWATVEPAYTKTLRQVARGMRQDGFRPGKVPVSIAEERVNRDYLIQEVMRAVGSDAFQAALKKSDVKLFAEPELLVKKADKNADWEIVAYLPQKTTVKLPDYKKFLANAKKRLLKTIQDEQAQLKKDAASKDKKEDKSPQPPTLTAEQMRARATDEALMELLRELQPKVSALLVRRTAQRELDKLAQQLQQYNLTLTDYFHNSGMSEQAVSQQYLLRALQDLQLEFILDALMTAEKVTVTDEEIQQALIKAMPDVTDETERQRQLAEPSVHDYIELMAKRQKLANWLLEL